jgi:hypothetical protein
MNNVQISKTDSAIVKYGGASAACAGLFLGVMLQFAPKQYEHESAHAPLSDQCQDRSVPHAEISSRFPCSPKEGLEFLETVWQQDTSVEGSAEWPRWRCAWLAGVCADSIGKRQVAKTWMTRFEDSFDACGHPFTDADIHYLTIVAGRFAPEPQLAPALWPVALFGLIGGGDPEPLAQILEEIDKSRKAVTDDDVLEQVRLMSWLLLAGEVIVESEEGTPSAGLLRNAIEAFDEGLSMLADLEKAFVEDPALEQRLTSSPENALVAMRYDAVRVRQTAIQKREALAKEKEFERLDALRELIAVEKSVMKEVGQLSFAMMNHDWNGVLNAGDKALSHIGAMQDIAKKKRDYYLLKEPKAISTNDQWSAIDPAIAPMSNGIVSSVKSMMALASARIAEQKLEKLEMGRNAGLDMGPDAESEIIELLDKSEDLLRRAITKVEDDPADGFDVDNAVAPYVEGLALETRARLSTFAKIGDRAAIHDVKASIEKAKEAFASIRSKFERWGADVTAGFLVTDADRRLEFLASKSAATTEAAEMSRAGRVSDAWALLGDAAEVHDSQELILERADAARRAKRKLEDTLLELDRAEASSLIPQHDLDAAITRAGLVLQEIGSLLAARHPSGPVKVDRGATLAKLKKINSTLRGAIEEAASDSATLPRAWAWLSLCLVYESQVADEQVNAERFVKESQRLAKDALFELEQKKPGIDDWDPGYVEAVVAAQLALGHTAAKMLPSHRDESRFCCSDRQLDFSPI